MVFVRYGMKTIIRVLILVSTDVCSSVWKNCDDEYQSRAQSMRIRSILTLLLRPDLRLKCTYARPPGRKPLLTRTAKGRYGLHRWLPRQRLIQRPPDLKDRGSPDIWRSIPEAFAPFSIRLRYGRQCKAYITDQPGRRGTYSRFFRPLRSAYR